MAYCPLQDEIFEDVNVTCDVVAGYEEEAIFILRKDIDFASLKKYQSETLKNTYIVPSGDSKITKDGTHGAMVYQLKNAFSGTTAEFAEGDNRNTITNTVAFNVWSTDDQSARQIDAMLNSTYVCILKQKYKGDDDNSGYVGGAVYRLFGVEGSGLKMTGASNDNYNETLGAGWTLTFTETGALKSASFIQKEGEDGKPSEQATEQFFQNLKNV